jgi:hypothetical protein
LGPFKRGRGSNTKIQERNFYTCHSSAEFSVEEEVEAVEAGPGNISSFKRLVENQLESDDKNYRVRVVPEVFCF